MKNVSSFHCLDFAGLTSQPKIHLCRNKPDFWDCCMINISRAVLRMCGTRAETRFGPLNQSQLTCLYYPLKCNPRSLINSLRDTKSPVIFCEETPESNVKRLKLKWDFIFSDGWEGNPFRPASHLPSTNWRTFFQPNVHQIKSQSHLQKCRVIDKLCE